jgi:hypothetical protein
MTAWPLVLGRLLTLLPTLSGWTGVAVYDGPPVTADVPIDYVTVGWVPGEDFGGSFEQVDEPGGMLTRERHAAVGDRVHRRDVDLPVVVPAPSPCWTPGRPRCAPTARWVCCRRVRRRRWRWMRSRSRRTAVRFSGWWSR